MAQHIKRGKDANNGLSSAILWIQLLRQVPLAGRSSVGQKGISESCEWAKALGHRMFQIEKLFGKWGAHSDWKVANLFR
jgi:hypothetical protein